MSGPFNQSSAGNTNTDGNDTKYYNDSQNKKNSFASNNVNSFNTKPNQKQNKNNRINMASNNVAPLRQQNFNSVSTEQITQQQNIKSNGSSRKQNKKKNKNNQNDANKPDENVVDANIRINDAPIRQVDSTSEMTTSERPDNTSLNSDQVSTFHTSQLLENFETYKDSNKILSDVTTTASVSNNPSFFPTKTEEVITEDQQPEPEIIELPEEAKPAQLNESETSLEFTSCCSTPMSHNDTKLSTNKETVSLEKVIASLDFKSNDMLAIDMDQFDHSNEDDEQTTTCIEGYNERQEEAQISVIEAKKNENSVPVLSCSNGSKTITLISLPTMDCPGEAVIDAITDELESNKHELEVTNQIEEEKLNSFIHLNGNLDEDRSEMGHFKPDLVNGSEIEPVISQLITVSPAPAEEKINEREADQCESEMNCEEVPYVQMKMLQEEFAGVESNLLETVETIQNEMDSLVKTQLDQSKKVENEEEIKVEETEKVEVNHFEQEKTETDVGVAESQLAIDVEYNSVESVNNKYRTQPAYEIRTQNDFQKTSFENDDESNEMTLLLKKNETSAITSVQLLTEEENNSIIYSSNEINSYINNIITSAIKKIESDDCKVSLLEQEIKINENNITDKINMQYIDEETTENNLILNDDSSSLAHKQVSSDHEQQADEKLLEIEAKSAEKNDAKTKKTNKKSAEPPVDCFPCSVL